MASAPAQGILKQFGVNSHHVNGERRNSQPAPTVAISKRFIEVKTRREQSEQEQEGEVEKVMAVVHCSSNQSRI